MQTIQAPSNSPKGGAIGSNSVPLGEGREGAAMLPVATRLASQVICLPMHPYLTNEDIEQVVNNIIK